MRLGHGENIGEGVRVEVPVREAGRAEGAGLCRHENNPFFLFVCFFKLRCSKFDPWVGKIPGGGNDNPQQYSCLGNPMDRGAWQSIVPRVLSCIVHGVASSIVHGGRKSQRN